MPGRNGCCLENEMEFVLFHLVFCAFIELKWNE